MSASVHSKLDAALCAISPAATARHSSNSSSGASSVPLPLAPTPGTTGGRGVDHQGTCPDADNDSHGANDSDDDGGGGTLRLATST